MYYRVAIQVNAGPTWQWRSTALSSLSSVFHFLRLFRGRALEQLRVFSCSTREGFQEQIEQQNQGCSSSSVTAAHFLQARLIQFSQGREAMPSREAGARQPMAAIAVASQPLVNQSSSHVNDLLARGISSLERRRLELELGPGGDHDIPYRLVLPASVPQALAWMRLLARVQRGDLPV